MPPRGRSLKVFQGSPHLRFLLPVSPSYISSQPPCPQYPSSSASKPLLRPCPGFANSSLLPVSSQLFFKALFSTLYYGLCLAAQSCQTLCDIMDCIPSGSSVHGFLSPLSILQAGILEWVAMPSSRGLFPTQGSNTSLPHYRWILYHLSHQ